MFMAGVVCESWDAGPGCDVLSQGEHHGGAHRAQF